MELKPTEFEHLIRQLFEAIGLDGVNTQLSKDEGVDAIAMNIAEHIRQFGRHRLGGTARARAVRE
ncbi:restriction endonuclease [Streptomyces sp. NBC_01142]|uniref:restriction endonuclease n=1 Tax=Streptomyces sp. NBC_01142 TaxID=2975865 RepID=UPI00225B5F80|nr:restriction endonuclease [Streptomyces sp. NBC_01142]MCX4821063.1 restriction endonuclease [Streptomyces sp. NBC_01142]